MEIIVEYRKKAVLEAYQTIEMSIVEFIEENEHLKIDEWIAGFSDDDWSTVVQEYIFYNLIEEMTEINKNFHSNALFVKHFNQVVTDILNIIRENIEFNVDGFGMDEIKNEWSYVYETIGYELERHFGSRLMLWVNVYEKTRHFGGHEEGGWWYDWDRCIESKEVYIGHEQRVKEQLQDKYGKGHGDIYSVLGGEEYHVRIEHLRAESESKERPRYS